MRRRRAWLDVLLLPAALLVVVLEDVVWAGARAVLRAASAVLPLQWLATSLARLPGWIALVMFLVPELLGRAGELWAVALLVQGHRKSAALTYLLVRVFATLIVVFIYHACEPALLRIRWFARAMGWAWALRDWAKAILQPARLRLRAMVRAAPGFATRRFLVLRHRVATRWRRVWR